MATLTKEENAWVEDVQAVFDRCPSNRIGFYTLPGTTVLLWNLDEEEAIDRCKGTFKDAILERDAVFDVEITLPGFMVSRELNR